jgi:heme exporter protein CcmD
MPSFAADPYAAYVCAAYGLSALVVGWLVVDSLLRARRWRRAAEARKGAVNP